MSTSFPLSIDTPLTRAALDIATKAHADQTRHDGKTPYITHPIAVSREAVYRFDTTNLSTIPCSYIEAVRVRELIAVLGVLHDVAEEDPRYKGFMGVEHRIIDSLRDAKLLEHDERDEYLDLADDLKRLNRINTSDYLYHILGIKGHARATFVKRADLWHNQKGDIPAARRAKYQMAEYILART